MRIMNSYANTYLYILLQDVSSVTDNSLVNRMINKRKSIAIPVDFARRRFLPSADEVSFIKFFCFEIYFIAAARVSLYSHFIYLFSCKNIS
mgnify:FL=1